MLLCVLQTTTNALINTTQKKRENKAYLIKYYQIKIYKERELNTD